MNYQEIKAQLDRNLTNYQVEEVRVQPDLFGGWRIAIVSSDFKKKSQGERREIALKDLENLEIEWLDLFTPEEKEWAGNLPLDSTLEDFPFWPEALARSSQTLPKVVFPSDLDEDIDLPIITTFYSLRGGVGRSTALAYTGQILARRGKTVLCVDMDLEAPGLAALFGKEAEMRPDQSLLSLLIALDQGTTPNIQEHLLRISETEELYCLPAGKPSANYARLLNFIAPEAWYREDRNPLRELIDLLGTQLTFKPDVILIDARTGMTPLNAPLLFDLADLAMIVFFPHPQTQSGTEALVKALLSTTTRRKLTPKLTPEPRFIVSPIPASKAPEVITRYQRRSLKWIQNWLSSLDRSPGMEIDENDITQFIPYQEVIATSDQVLSERNIWQDFEPIADWIEGFIPTRSEQQLQLETKTNLKSQKLTILEELKFSGGTAEDQDSSLLIETFVNTALMERALHPQNPLILGRKGTGKTAIFRRISEGRCLPSESS
ncbi:MAG: CpsD/CapB family tyrosine-protein kinase [Kamptonema sp. SIO4C4]|nr:CpsD/CapB family tyrosine-protein kinase [Kamptonema sp. SIO4C4]